MHGAQVSAAGPEKVPTGQREHWTAAWADAAVPGVQGAQAVLPMPSA
jgi:hypothetical protein